ncbi:nucleotidyltransferase family protein [Candidatus Bipolaricaulota bacterium]
MRPTLSDTLQVLLPSEEDTLLLRACVGTRNTRENALTSWLEHVRDPRQELVQRRPVLSPLLPLLDLAARQDNLKIPQKLAFAIRAATFREELRSHEYRKILREVLLTLRGRDIDITVLKGAALAATVYDNWPLRHCHDIDLLVDPANLQNASRMLKHENLGEPCQPALTRDKDVRLIHKSGLPIELHTDPFVRNVPRRTAKAVLSRRLTTEIAGIPVCVLSPADELLHVCALASRFRSRTGLRWVADACSVVAACAELDWNVFLDTAMASGLSLPLFVLIEYLHSELDAAVPYDVLKSLLHQARHARRLEREAALFGASASLRQLRSKTSNWRSHAFLLRWRLVPTPSYLGWLFREDPLIRGLLPYVRKWMRRAAQHIRRAMPQANAVGRSGCTNQTDLPQVKTRIRRPWMPTEQQLLLLRAALLDEQPAIDAWNQWRSGGGLARIAAGSVVLLPIAYRNLADHGVRGDEIDYARRLYQVTNLKNEQLFRSLSSLLESFEAAGIETMIMKGASLALLHYQDLGMRSMGDVDLLIHPDDVAKAVELLTDLKWRRTGHAPQNLTKTYLSTRRAMNFSSSSITKLDLHWHAMDETQHPGGDDPFWKESIRTAVYGVKTRAMCPTDHLFHICSHETRRTPVPLPRWIADAVTVLKTSGNGFNWDRFATHAQHLRLSMAVREALEQVAESIDWAVPTRVLSQLQQLPISTEEKRRYEARCLPKKDGLVATLRREYQRMPEQYGRWRFVVFPSYMRELWGLEHVWQLPRSVFLWATRILKRTVRNWTRRLHKRPH